MTPTRQGSFHLFRFAGVDVFLHWSWFLIALYEINFRRSDYSSLFWNALEYLSLFLIVLLHEFGHSLACRSVGGSANQIVLWPLGGVAYVAPPSRPGATLWSIAAGPLVNVVLLPLFTVVVWWSRLQGWADTLPILDKYVQAVWLTNAVLLGFNLLPIYPLDGGQILRSLLWFVVGRAKSLLVTTIIGFVGVAAMIALAVFAQSIWIGIMAGFILLNCWGGLKQAQALVRLEKMPRHQGYACPSCRTAPPIGEFWLCGHCRKPFDSFVTHAGCPHCGAQFGATNCTNCGEVKPFNEWIAP
jgi:Zn-dependent protease